MVETPLGKYESRIDSKGRLRLPVIFQLAMADQEWSVHGLPGGKEIQIRPGADGGQRVEISPEGRVLIPRELREEYIEQAVSLRWIKDHIVVSLHPDKRWR